MIKPSTGIELARLLLEAELARLRAQTEPLAAPGQAQPGEPARITTKEK